MAEDEPNRITRILQKGFGGIKKAYQHPVTQKIGSGAKYTAAAGAGLMGGLAVGSYKGGKWAVQKTGDIWLIFFPILLWLFDYQAGIQGIQFSWNLVGGYDGLLDFFIDFVFRSPYLLFLGLFFIFRGLPSKNELPYYAIVVGLFVFLWGLVGGNLWIFIHLIFAIFVFIFLLKGHDKNVVIDSRHWIFIIIVLWDIFDFPLFELAYNGLIGGALIGSIIENKLLFPIWVFYFFTFIRSSLLKKILLTTIWLFYFGLIGFQFYEIYGDLATTTVEQQQAVIDAPKRVIKTYGDLVRSWLTGRIQYAITGKVEQYEHEPVGVFLENVRSADKFYYEGEDAVIWGTIRARTLDDPINVEVGCFVKEGEIEIKTLRDYVDPKDKFSVFTYEENDFACTMKNLDEDTNRVTAFAEFNFETEAKQKVYLIDRETLRSMTRENIDPFAKEKITDRKPIARFTNGPVKIEMGLSSSYENAFLIGVSESYPALPTLAIILSNNEGWQGKLTELRELAILLPEEIELFRTERICDFEPYSEEDCKNSIDKNIGTECKETCRVSANVRCMNECEDKVEELIKDCSNLYAESGQKFNGYKIKLREKVEYDQGENFEEILCRFRPNLEVLENPGITIKDFRVKTRYVYRVEKPVTVQIEKLEERFIPTIEDYLIKTLTDKQKETGSKVKSIAKEVSFANQDMLAAIAYVESELRHCKDFETSCGKDDVFNKNENYGVMQLNRNTHCAWFYPQICSTGLEDTSKCSGVYAEIGGGADVDCDIWENACTNTQTAYDLDCNIKLGIAFLNKLHIQYSNGIKFTCTNEKGSVDTTYGNWDAALRAYDGLVCLRTDPLYVEKVNKAIKELKIDFLPEKELTINLRIQSNGSEIKLNWDLTDKILGEEKVIAYEIYKKTVNEENYKQIQRISKGSDAFKKREYADTNIDLSGQFAYFYYIKAIFDNGLFEESVKKEFSYVSVQ